VIRTKSALCLVVLVVSLSFNVGWNGTAGATTWPRHLAGQLLEHRQKSFPFGRPVAKSHLLVGWMDPKNYRGTYSYALADIGDYEYPVSTIDHGQQWRIAGNYFNLDDTSGMGAGNSPSNIVTLSPTIVVAYRRGDIMGPTSAIFVTVDSGRQWYISYAPGTVKKITAVLGSRDHSVLKSVTAMVSSLKAPGKERVYESLNGGLSWSLT
jgi:hypothetical protein